MVAPTTASAVIAATAAHAGQDCQPAIHAASAMPVVEPSTSEARRHAVSRGTSMRTVAVAVVGTRARGQGRAPQTGAALQARRNTRVPLVPPKPKLFFKAMSIFIWRAVLAQ